jgi:DNA repair protein RadC
VPNGDKMEFVIIVFVATILIFVFLHIRPMTELEINILAQKQRNVAINRYYKFAATNVIADQQFKKNMNAAGTFYNISVTLSEFPAYASALLKYKKHEWIIIGFERNRNIDKIWVNKGDDSSSAYFGISIGTIKKLSIEGDYATVIVFHNHPNSNPSYYSTRYPSPADKEVAKKYGNELLDADINLINFVCERGMYYQYWRSISNTFLQISNYSNEIMALNGKSWFGNFNLHWNRLFG